MQKGLLIFGALFLCLGIGVRALDLSSYGYEVLGTHNENGLTFYDAKDASGLSFAVASAAPLTEDNIQVVRIILSTFEHWKYLKVSRIRIVFSVNNHADILVIPTSFDYKGVDLSTYMPSGMQFSYDGYLGYDFRMYKDNLFMRLEGQVFGETDFANRLLDAVNNPVLYVQTNSPEYLLKQIGGLETKVEDLTVIVDALRKQLNVMSHGLVSLNNRGFFGTIFPVDTKAVDRVVALKTQNPSMTPAQVAAELAKEGIKISDNAIRMVFGVYFDAF